tara:strand:- start:1120 stop:1632 length:513 start_codon:yes stop_codon:yes gene_type:complete
MNNLNWTLALRRSSWLIFSLVALFWAQYLYHEVGHVLLHNYYGSESVIVFDNWHFSARPVDPSVLNWVTALAGGQIAGFGILIFHWWPAWRSPSIKDFYNEFAALVIVTSQWAYSWTEVGRFWDTVYWLIPACLTLIIMSGIIIMKIPTLGQYLFSPESRDIGGFDDKAC